MTFRFATGVERARCASIKQRVVQIVPVRILFLDQFEFPLAFPSLDGFLARDRGLHRCVLLEPQKLMHVVVPRESADGACLVFVHALEQR